MVAYSFKTRFAAPILAGTKRQTIRADRKRHVRPGEELQLYTGMRTRHCKLIGRAVCEAVYPIELFLAGPREGYSEAWSDTHADPRFATAGVYKADCNKFAVADGFARWSDLVLFWRAEHPGVDHFGGVLIRWTPIVQEPV